MEFCSYEDDGCKIEGGKRGMLKFWKGGSKVIASLYLVFGISGAGAGCLCLNPTLSARVV